MYNKKKCKNCVYMTYFNSMIACGYNIHSPEHKPCLRLKKGKVVDMRGSKGDDCKLYVAKTRKRDKVNITLPRKAEKG